MFTSNCCYLTESIQITLTNSQDVERLIIYTKETQPQPLIVAFFYNKCDFPQAENGSVSLAFEIKYKLIN